MSYIVTLLYALCDQLNSYLFSYKESHLRMQENKLIRKLKILSFATFFVEHHR